MPITALSQLNTEQHYTYADYLKWRLKERVELFKGRISKMSPAPNVRHQRIVGKLFNQLFNYLEQQSCEVFTAPFDLRLPLPPGKQQPEQIDTVVQPDLCVICDLSKLDEQGCIGPPDLVVEVLSPGNTNREMKDKFELYQSAAVPEYWIIDPEREHLLQYLLNEDGQYTTAAPLVSSDTLHSHSVKGFSLPLSSLFN